MPRPIPDTVPQDIAEIIRSNPKWGDLASFAKAEGLTQSAIYSVFLYSKHRPLHILDSLGKSTKTSADKVYAVLSMANVDRRKEAFERMYKTAGFKNLTDFSKDAGIAETTIRRYLDAARPPKAMATYHHIGNRLEISLQEFANKCRSH